MCNLRTALARRSSLPAPSCARCGRSHRGAAGSGLGNLLDEFRHLLEARSRSLADLVRRQTPISSSLSNRTLTAAPASPCAGVCSMKSQSWFTTGR
jgi:hypothetical protein